MLFEETVPGFHGAPRLTGNLLLQELKGNIRVHCRIRPLLPFDDEAQEPVSQNR